MIVLHRDTVTKARWPRRSRRAVQAGFLARRQCPGQNVRLESLTYEKISAVHNWMLPGRSVESPKRTNPSMPSRAAKLSCRHARARLLASANHPANRANNVGVLARVRAAIRTNLPASSPFLSSQVRV